MKLSFPKFIIFSRPAATANGNAAQTSGVQSVNLQQYLTAAALLNTAANFCTDGSGDGPSGCQWNMQERRSEIIWFQSGMEFDLFFLI